MALKITTTESLNNEISRLQARAKVLEEKLDDNLDYLQDNYSSMIMGSIFKGDGVNSSFAGSIGGFLLGNDRLREALVNIVNALTDVISGWIEKLADKLSRK